MLHNAKIHENFKLKKLSSLSHWLAGHEAACAAILVILVAALNYAPFFSQIGFYKEDWYVIWTGLVRGASAITPMFQSDRPLVGYLYQLTFPLLGANPASWQVYAFAMRLVASLGLLWALRMAWPQRKVETTTIAVLATVYPGFLQQFQAATFHYHMTAFALASLSIALSVYALRAGRVVGAAASTLGGMLCAVGYMPLMEYFIGLEGLRLALLAAVISGRDSGSSRRQMAWRTLKAWAPYLLVLAGFLTWRVFLFQGTRQATNIGRVAEVYAANLSHQAVRIAVELARDLVEVVVLAWGVPLDNFSYWGNYQELLGGLALVSAAMAGYLIYMRTQRMSEEADSLESAAVSEWETNKRMKSGKIEALSPEIGQVSETSGSDPIAWKWALWGGLLVTLVALAPAILAGKDVRFFDREDRYALPALIGAVVTVVGLISAALRPRLRTWVAAFLLGTAMLAHYNRGLYMADFWSMQKQLWWQLSWRAPQIKPGTLLFAQLPSEYVYSAGHEIWAPANIIYYSEAITPTVTGEVLDSTAMYRIFQGAQDLRVHRQIELERNYAAPLVLTVPRLGACLNALDGPKYELSEAEAPMVRLVAPYSTTSQILTQGEFLQPPANIFGAEPEHRWCYYYQKAAYARQVGDWREIVRLAEEAKANDYSPAELSEWMPFLEGYAMTGQERRARQLAATMKVDRGMQKSICWQLEGLQVLPPGYELQKVLEILCK